MHQEIYKADEALSNYTELEETPPEKRAGEKAVEASTKVNKTVMSVIHQVFSPCSNLLTEEVMHHMIKIVSLPLHPGWISMWKSILRNVGSPGSHS